MSLQYLNKRKRERERMEVAAFHPLYSYLFPSAQNYVHWSRTPESHLYSADIPGVRKEEIKVEVEDSRYLIIRTEAAVEEPHRSFSRKFRLPEQVDVDGISAEYVDGVLTVKVPRSYVRRGFFIDLADRPQRLDFLASAA